MRAPLVALVGYRLPVGRVTGWDTGAIGVPGSYVEALRRGGARSAVLCPGDDARWGGLDGFDGLLLAGGGDVLPDRYGAGPHPSLYGLDPLRDELEIELVRAAAASGLPTFGICRGAQVINVALGGTLIQHLPEVPGSIGHGVPGGGPPSLHEVKVAESSLLSAACGDATLICSSQHHQGLEGLGDGLTPVAWTEDGLVEAVEHEEGWMVAVQWHPEVTAGGDPSQQALFDAFVERAAGPG